MGWKHDIVKQQQPKQRGSGNLQTFIDELVTDDPSLAGRIKYGMLGAEEENSNEKAAREKEYEAKLQFGHKPLESTDNKNDK